MNNPHDPQVPSDSIPEAIANVMRYLCLIGIFMLLVVGVYQASIVFQQVGRLITDTKHVEASVDQIAKMIDTESLKIVQQDNVISFGRLISFLLLLVCYLVWLWVPLAIIATCARLLLVGLMPRGRTVPVKTR
ncbi:MAG: hypothetical protein O3C60_15645 [Planctomycetota bacterium]|nr:hypothetical protein [Planctomycetota bacterium]